MQVRVMGQRRAPGVQHADKADPGAEVLGVPGDGDQGLGGGLEQDAVDHRLVVVGDVGDRRRQGEDDVVILHRQEFSLARGQPVLGRRALTLRAVAVAAGIVGDVGMAALLAGRHVAAERRRAAGATGCPRCSYAGDAPAAPGLDGRHHLKLAEAQVAGPGAAPGRPVGAEDVRDLQRSTTCPASAATTGAVQTDLCRIGDLQLHADRDVSLDVLVLREGDPAAAARRRLRLVPSHALRHCLHNGYRPFIGQLTQTKLDWVHARCLGELVHEGFERENIRVCAQASQRRGP